MVDPDAFRREQAKFCRVWTLLGLTTDIRRDNDWIRATIGGRSVFVQRFGDTIRGFENVCRHRFYPLRTKDRGNGVVRCGFHHWQYNKDGDAVGIPHCQQLFGKTVRELGVRLQPVEIATCGILIFGRFPAEGEAETLEQFLGDACPILQAMCSEKRSTLFHVEPGHCELEIAVSCDNGRLSHCRGTSVDIRQVWLSSFEDGPLLSVWRHSAFFHEATDGALELMVDGCRPGTYRPNGYRVIKSSPICWYRSWAWVCGVRACHGM